MNPTAVPRCLLIVAPPPLCPMVLKRIQPYQIKFERKLAAGSEGEVWLGELQNQTTGKWERTAIKKALSNPTAEESTTPVFEEREVAVLTILSQHSRVVKFLGAGVLEDPRLGEEVLFMCQEFATGGSIDKALWGTSLDSLTWQHRVQWACDIAEGMAFIHCKVSWASCLAI